MNKTPIAAILFFSVLLLINPSLDANVDTSGIDWQNNIITSSGISSISVDTEGNPLSIYDRHVISINEARRNAYDRAREIAMEKMISLLKTVRVNQDLTLEELLRDEPFTRKRLNDVLDRTALQQFPVDFYSSGCRIRLSMGDIIGSLPFTFPGNDFPSRMDVPIETSYTGLIIDTRGLHIKPMIFPVIYNRHGLEVISRHHISSSCAVKYGMVSYTTGDREARKIRRLGEHPLYVVALNENRGCPVLSEKDVRRIFSSPETLKAMKECRIVFIIDGE